MSQEIQIWQGNNQIATALINDQDGDPKNISDQELGTASYVDANKQSIRVQDLPDGEDVKIYLMQNRGDALGLPFDIRTLKHKYASFWEKSKQEGYALVPFSFSIPSKLPKNSPLKDLAGKAIPLDAAVDTDPTNFSFKDAQAVVDALEDHFKDTAQFDAVVAENPTIQIGGDRKRLSEIYAVVNGKESVDAMSEEKKEEAGLYSLPSIKLPDTPDWEQKIRKANTQLRKFIDYLIMLLLGTLNPDLVAMVTDLNGLKESLLGAEVGLDITKFKEKKEKTVKKLYDKVWQLAKELEKKPKEAGRINAEMQTTYHTIEQLNAIDKTVDGLVQQAMSAAEETRNVAKSLREVDQQGRIARSR